ncbi:MAG: LOG family protein [Phycisphaerae bacterium]|nr:LOG family protein [Phycisphaerae bacterium]
MFGSNAPVAGDAAYAQARAAGRKLAELGYAVANGGYGGTMAASARGAKDAGGRTIGVTCRIWSPEPNAFTDECVVTDTLAERVETLLRLGAAGYVVLPGGTGTLVELATAWELMGKGLMRPRPLVCLGGFWRPLVDMMTSVRANAGDIVTVVEPVDALDGCFPRHGGAR